MNEHQNTVGITAQVEIAKRPTIQTACRLVDLLADLKTRLEQLTEMVANTADGKPLQWRTLNPDGTNTDSTFKPMSNKEFLNFLWEQMLNLASDFSQVVELAPYAPNTGNNLTAYDTLTAKLSQAEAVSFFIQADFENGGGKFSLGEELVNNGLWALQSLITEARHAARVMNNAEVV